MDAPLWFIIFISFFTGGNFCIVVNDIQRKAEMNYFSVVATINGLLVILSMLLM